MLELCKNVLRTCLAERVELQKQLAKTRAEIERLRRRR